MDKRKINQKFPKKKSMTHFYERNDEKPCWRSQKPLGIPDKRVRNELIFAGKFWSIAIDARRSFWLTNLHTWFTNLYELLFLAFVKRTSTVSEFTKLVDLNRFWFTKFRQNILRLNDKLEHMCASSISWVLFLFFRGVLLLRVSLF